MSTILERNRPEECLSDFALDRRLLGELSEEEEQQAKRHLFECATCAERQEALQRDREMFAASAGELAGLLATKERKAPTLRLIEGGAGAPLQAPSSWRTLLERSRAWIAIAALAASVAIVAIVLSPQDAFVEGGVRAKGSGIHFGVYIKHGETIRSGSPNEIVHPGDLLRFSYATRAPRYIAVLSLDGEHHASTYFPSGPVAQKLPASSDGALPDGIQLDGALGREKIFGLFCDNPIEIEPLRKSLETQGVLPASSCDIESLELLKTP